MFFDENGMLNVDELVLQNEVFRNIMADGVVSENEIRELSDKVLADLHSMEERYSEEQLAEIKTLVSDFSVLYAVYQQYSIQSIK